MSLPTPLAPVTTFVALRDRPEVEPAYERRLLEELEEILAEIPHAQLAIQWDVAAEIAILEGTIAPTHLQSPWQEIAERLVQLGKAVPPAMELGYHFCYGDRGHQHFKQPADTGLVVQLANQVAGHLVRPLNWIHLPVPLTRGDDGYFAPLENLQARPDTEVYVGLVHHHDGISGAQQLRCCDRVRPW
ncbi:MAG: hypothetical protein JO352_11790 [Chloroflexi bacterium]|nr:hypothetical protein [Chloroflexota bacterium]